MKDFRWLLFGLPLAVLTWLVYGIGHAQDTATLGTEIIKVYKGEGYYEYNTDGVPLIGVIATRMDNNRVKFTTCSNRTLELDLNQLKRSKAECPADRKHGGIWTVNANNIAPVFKVGDNPTPTKVRFDGKIQHFGVPDEYKQSISSAKSGGLIGYAFTDNDGKKSLMIFKSGEPGAAHFLKKK